MKRIWLLFFALLLAGLPLRLPGPWTDDFSGLNGAYFATMVCRSWDLLGFEESRGVPYAAVVPSIPPYRQEQSRYLNHPPTLWWSLYGFRELSGHPPEPWGYRLLPTLIHALLGVLLVSMAARAWGAFAALAMALLFATLPATLLYGSNASYEPGSLLLGLGLLALHERTRTAPWGRRLLLPAAFALALLWDWMTAPWALAVLFAELARPAGERRWSAPFLAGMGSLGGGALFVAWLAWIVGGFGAVFEQLLALVGTTASGHGALHDQELVPKLARNVWVAFGPALLLAAFGGSAWALLQRRRSSAPRGWPLFGALAVGIVCCALFPVHTAVHEFWVLYLTPGLLFGAVLLLALVRAKKPRLAIALLVLVVSGNAIVATQGMLDRPNDAGARAEEYGSLAADGELLVFPTWMLAGVAHVREPFAIQLAGEELKTLHVATAAGMTPWPGYTVLIPSSFIEGEATEVRKELRAAPSLSMEVLAALPGVRQDVLGAEDAPLTLAAFNCERVYRFRYRRP